MSQHEGHVPSARSPFAAEVEAERSGWYEIQRLVRQLTPAECAAPGYYSNPDWSIADLAAHLGTWLAEGEVQFQRISVGSYEGHADVDIDALNARFLAAMAGQPWHVCWLQANAGRTRMLDEWSHLAEPSDEAAWWVRKVGGDHYAEHVDRLREWTAELLARRAARFG